MAIKLGTTDINKVYLGSTQVNKMYLGSTVVLNGGSPGYDTDAQAYITAHGNLTVAQEGVINDFFVALKTGYATDIHAKLKALWLPMFTTAVDNKWNLINPLDTDAAHRLTYTGTITHNLDGIKGDGSTSHIDTHYNPVVESDSISDFGFGFVKKDLETNGTTRIYMGSENGSVYNFMGLLSGGSYETSAIVSTKTSSQYTPSSSTGNAGHLGFVLANLDSGGARVLNYYLDGVKRPAGDVTMLGIAFPNLNIYFLANNNNGSATSKTLATKIQLSYISSSLTETEITNFNTEVQILVTSIH